MGDLALPPQRQLPAAPQVHHVQPTASSRPCSMAQAQMITAIGAGIVLLVLGSVHLHRHIPFGGIPWLQGLDPGVAPTSTTQATRLRVTNGCAGEDMWLARSGYGDALRIPPSHSFDVEVPHEGTSTFARFWPRFRCDEQGRECAIGSTGTRGDPVLDRCR